jgi:hypothetical protein
MYEKKGEKKHVGRRKDRAIKEDERRTERKNNTPEKIEEPNSQKIKEKVKKGENKDKHNTPKKWQEEINNVRRRRRRRRLRRSKKMTF